MDHLPNIASKMHKRILLLWACAIMWIYIGNIINFHQHHIWGKQLIPVACTNNRTKEKSLVNYHGNSGDHSSVSFPSGWQNGNTSVVPEISFPVATISFHSFTHSPSSKSIPGTPLRAPPMA